MNNSINDNSRDFKGVWIPKNVWLDDRLSALDKIILVEIDSLDNGEKGCFASNKYLAEFCQCSETKISNTIQKLSKLKYIEVKSFDGRSRKIQSRLTKSVRQLTESVSLDTKDCKADLQNLQHINKDNNIINKDNIKAGNSKQKSSSKRKTKKEKGTDLVVAKFEEYDFSERVKSLLLEFYDDRMDNKDYPASNQLTIMFNELSQVSEQQQYDAISNSIKQGYKGIFINKNNSTKQSYRLDTTDLETVEEHNQRIADMQDKIDNDSGELYRF